MRISAQLVKVISSVLLLLICMTGCEKEVKKGKVVVENYKYVINHDSTHLYEVNAEGTIKNIGDYDVKNVVVTGYCRSCQQKMIEGVWFDSSNIPKTPEEKAVINYLKPGEEAPFKFKAIADMLSQGAAPSKLPEKMEIKIVSFDTVQ